MGGLEQYVKALKEMVFLPLVYPELFERFHITPPRGVLFYGPPGMNAFELTIEQNAKQDVYIHVPSVLETSKNNCKILYLQSLQCTFVPLIQERSRLQAQARLW